MPTDFELDAARLIMTERWAAIATMDRGVPLATMVAYAPERALGGLLIFVSELSQHTRNLLQDPRVSLVVSEADTGEGDPQLLARVTLTGEVRHVRPGSQEYAAAKSAYLARFPGAEPRFDLADFHLLRLVPSDIRYVGGFARAFSISAEDLTTAAAAVAEADVKRPPTPPRTRAR
ncbi:MAG TPA: pyridoxamine 5'-phosphate oxidase family protein [Vicinamibacterales bacterium]|jgi:hypothetical protein